jgi:hypothetical protein
VRLTVAKWLGRFTADRLEGLTDEPRPGRPRTVTDTKVHEVINEDAGTGRTERGLPLVDPVDGEGDRPFAVDGVADVARVRVDAADAAYAGADDA